MPTPAGGMTGTALDLPWGLVAEDLGFVIFLLLLAVFLFYGTINLLLELKFRPTPLGPPHPNPERVAIIVPIKDDPSIFNSVPYLRAIDYSHYEVLIIDDSKDPAFRSRVDALAGGQIRILRRPTTRGRKGTALNFALESLAQYTPKFVVILDADHRPPPDFLAKAVTAIEDTEAHCVVGYQRHDVGSTGFFGLTYRAGVATAMRNLKARYDLRFGAFFPGAAAIFNYEWLRARGFDETSITEDWELSFRSYTEGDFRIVVREDLWVSAAVPNNLWGLVHQHIRWIAGTTRDFRKHARRLLRARLPLTTKIGLASQGLAGIQAAAFLLLGIVLPLPFPVKLPLWVSLGTLVFLGIAWGWPVVRGSKYEGYTLRQTVAVLAFGFVCAYVLAPFGAYAFFVGLLRDPTFRRVTKRRG